MPRNGSGGYTPPLNSWNPPINSAQALPADWQAILADLASAIQASIAADGQTPISGILDFNNNRISGVGAPIGQGDALRFEQLTKGSNIASATTITIPKEGSLFEITGTTDIASITDTYPGRVVLLKFQDVLTLEHSSALVMPAGANIDTFPGDVALFINEDTGTWRCAYYPQRILGTVSQSGGVPTGSIIESGTNANGRYTKWADGTMICELERNFGTGTWLGSGLPYYRGPESILWPATFSAPPRVVAQVNESDVSGRSAFVSSLTASTTGATGIYFSGFSNGNSGNVIATFIATGRWF